MPRTISSKARFFDAPILRELGITTDMVKQAIEYAYGILDGIDETLQKSGTPRLTELIELANLSAVLGNLFRGGFASASAGRFKANRPHKYPDLLANDPAFKDLEIKVALETNKPKGHLVKPGPHITLRYVLGAADGSYLLGRTNRGNVIWFWEVRAGYLNESHFGFSSTEGDSGKTAVITGAGMEQLDLVFCDLEKCPFSPRLVERRYTFKP